jgi:hypothetical protein
MFWAKKHQKRAPKMPPKNRLGVVNEWREKALRLIYHNISNQAEAEDEDAADDRRGANVFGNVRLEARARDIVIQREVAMARVGVRRRQQFNVFADGRFAEREICEKLRRLVHHLTGEAFDCLDALVEHKFR